MSIAIFRAAAVAAVLAAPVAWPQETTIMTAPGNAAGPIGIKVMTAEAFGGATVAGAPYAAEQTTRTTQSLADGNRIVNTSTAKIYRDQQGRTRIEQTLGSIGGVSTAEPPTIVSINDPVAKIRYTLHPDSRTAEKMETNGIPPVGKEATFFFKQNAESQAIVTKLNGPVTVGAAGVLAYQPLASSKGAYLEEDLGIQVMEGLQVQGKRTTNTIPAGAIGNEQPIKIVDERWYSPELQMNIMTKHVDPRMGETVFTIANVGRANPDSSLFAMPADYQVTSSQNMMFRVKKSPEE